MIEKAICEIPKKSRETIQLRLGSFKKFKFADLRIYVSTEEGQVPTPRGLTVSPHLWPQFKAGLAALEAKMIEEGLIDRADLEVES